MERSSALQIRQSVLLERILLCASSALASALATLSIVRLLKKRRAHRESKLLAKADSETSAERERRERQILNAVAKVKELEASLSISQVEQEKKGRQSSHASQQIADAAKVEKELRHELGKVKFAAKELQDAYRAVFADKEAAHSQARKLQQEKDALEKEASFLKNRTSTLLTSLTTQESQKKAAEKQAKKLQLDVSTAQSSKLRAESKFQESLQELEGKLSIAETARRGAEADLSQHQARIAPMKSRVEAFARGTVQLQERLEGAQQALVESQRRLATEHQRRAALEPQIASAQKRIRELEAELKILREAARSHLRRTSSRGSIAPQQSATA